MTRADILAKARVVFAHKGYESASLREIAESVGIKAPSLYAHFVSKEALYEAVYAEVTVEHTAYFDILARESLEIPPLARLKHLLEGIEAYYRDRPDLAEFSLRAAIAEAGAGGESLRQIFLDYESALADAVRRAHRDGVERGVFAVDDSDGFTALFLIVMDGLFLQLTHYAPETYRARFDLAWSYLAAILAR